MSKMQKYLIGLAAVCVVFFGFVIVRIGIAQPNDDSVKLAKISHEDYAHLGKAAYKDAVFVVKLLDDLKFIFLSLSLLSLLI